MQTAFDVPRVTGDEPSRAASLLPAPQGALVVEASPPPAKRPVRLSVVIPTYNEGKNIREMVIRLTDLLEGPLRGAYELIVVDDDSPDRTWEIASRLTARYPKLRVIRRRGERGLSTAVIRGWQAARGDVLGVIDADLQHPPEVTLDLWRSIRRGADLAVGSRHVDGGGVSDWAFHRRVLSRGARLLGLALLPGVVGRVSDPMSGYFMVRRRAIAGKTMSPLGYKILLEVIGRGDIRRVGEVGYVFRERLEGQSKVTWKLYVDYLRHLARLRVDSLPVARFTRFAAVGLSGVAVDMLLLFLLGDPRALALPLTLSKLVAAGTAMANNFLWNDAWTFRDGARRGGGAARKLERFARYALVCGAGVALNVALLHLQTGLFGLNRYLANAVAIGLVTLFNFALISRIYRRAAAPPAAGAAAPKRSA